ASGRGLVAATDVAAVDCSRASAAAASMSVGAMLPALSASAVRAGSSERKLGRSAAATWTGAPGSGWPVTLPSTTVPMMTRPAARAAAFLRPHGPDVLRGFILSSCCLENAATRRAGSALTGGDHPELKPDGQAGLG